MKNTVKIAKQPDTGPQKVSKARRSPFRDRAAATMERVVRDNPDWLCLVVSVAIGAILAAMVVIVLQAWYLAVGAGF